jgi:hypothetical protein
MQISPHDVGKKAISYNTEIVTADVRASHLLKVLPYFRHPPWLFGLVPHYMYP